MEFEKKKSKQNKTQGRKLKEPFCAVEGPHGVRLLGCGCSGGSIWQMLSPNAVFLFLEFYRKYRGGDSRNLCVTYKEMAGKLSSGSYSLAIWELLCCGFLDRVKIGRLEREASIYGFSDRWKGFEFDSGTHGAVQKTLKELRQVHKLKKPAGLSKEQGIVFRDERRTKRRAIQAAILGDNLKTIIKSPDPDKFIFGKPANSAPAASLKSAVASLPSSKFPAVTSTAKEEDGAVDGYILDRSLPSGADEGANPIGVLPRGSAENPPSASRGGDVLVPRDVENAQVEANHETR